MMNKIYILKKNLIKLGKTKGFEIIKASHSEYKWKCMRGHIISGEIYDIAFCYKCINEDYNVDISFDIIKDKFVNYTGNVDWLYNYNGFNGYNKKLKLAYNFKQPQDSNFLHIFYKNHNLFKHYIKSMENKKKYCKKNKINLIIIPYTKRKSNLNKFIKNNISSNNNKENILITTYEKNSKRYKIIKFLLKKFQKSDDLIDLVINKVYLLNKFSELRILINIISIMSNNYNCIDLYDIIFKKFLNNFPIIQ